MNQILDTSLLQTHQQEDFSMQALMNIMGQNLGIVNALGSKITEISSHMNNMHDDMQELKEDIADLQLNEEVTTLQQETVIQAARERVNDILGKDVLIRQKYYRIFATRLYSDARRYASLGSKIACTKKRDSQRVLDYIEAWSPTEGSDALKKRADMNAEARRISRELGYS